MYKPKHYESSQATVSFQPIDICRELPFSLGNAIKYVLRAPYKGNVKGDYLKAIDYLKDVLNFGYVVEWSFSPKFKVALDAYCENNAWINILFNRASCSEGEEIEENIIIQDDEDLDILITEESVKRAISDLRHRIKLLKKVQVDLDAVINTMAEADK